MVKGERLDSMNHLARVELPPWGPWSFGGSFRASPRGYEVPDLAVHVGSSSLDGHGSLNVAAQRPRLDLSLTAPRVQLNDFKFGTWSPVEKKESKPEKPMSVEELRAKAKEGAAQAQKLLSRDTLLRARCLPRRQRGAGAVRRRPARQRQAPRAAAGCKARVGPATVNVPGGSATVKFSYEPTGKDVAVTAQIRVDRFDYGILARRIKPDTDLQGLFSLNVDVEGRAPNLDAVMTHANGRIDFAVWPKNMRSGIFDLWAVNLFVALAPAVDPAKESKVNCALGPVRSAQRQAHSERHPDGHQPHAGDRRRAGGLRRRGCNLRLSPKPKSPQFFSLATPVAVSGTFTDFKIGVAPGGVADTTARLLTSLFVVPVEKLVKGRPPRDGADVCTNALRAIAQK